MKTLVKLSAAEYLNFERAAEQRHELINGILYDMAGTSNIHSDIVYNISFILRLNAPKDFLRNFKVKTNDMRVYNPVTGDYYYPDVVVARAPVVLAPDKYNDNLLNPLIIFEVLSFSTEKIDRTLKKEAYESIESLADYLIVSQTETRVERFTKNESGKWNEAVLYTDRSEKIDLGFSVISLDEIYYEINL